MNRFVSVLGDCDTESGRALLREQWRALRQQIPFMYILIFVNSASLSLATYGHASVLLTVGFPGLLSFITFVRAGLWLARRHNPVPTPEGIQVKLGITLGFALLLAIGFTGWGLALFSHVDLVRRACIGVFIFTAAISCSFCLQTFPFAARLVLFVGTGPVILRMLLTDEWFLRGFALNLLFVALLNHRVIATNQAGFVEVLSSRSRIEAESERARQAERQAHQLAYHDALTNLPNRRALSENLEQIIATRGEHAGAALLIIDLDRFKQVNDVHGHPTGDELLRSVAERLRTIVEPDAEAFRLGGDEFAVLALIDPVRGQSPTRLARQIVEAMEVPFKTSGLNLHVGASVGIALFPRHADDRETLMRKADIALYDAKVAGRGTFRLFEPQMEDVLRHRSSIETSLREDIKRGAMNAHLQPIVDLISREVVGYELLARWCRGGTLFVGPDQFIPVAEECGLINEIMLALLEQGCCNSRSITGDKPIAVNISPVQLKDPLLGERILAVLDGCNYPPHLLGIEVTENALVSDSESARRTIESLKARGIQVALDDFGTGYSSLRHLHLLPFDKIKIDRSFVAAMEDDPEALTIVRAIINLANSMGLCTVAEGVESESIARRLQSLGCQQGQGYHFGYPFPAGCDCAEAGLSAA